METEQGPLWKRKWWLTQHCVSTEKQTASSVRGSPLSQASLKPRPSPAHNKYISSVCKHRVTRPNPWGMQTYVKWFWAHRLFPQAGLACHKQRIRNNPAVLMGFKYLRGIPILPTKVLRASGENSIHFILTTVFPTFYHFWNWCACYDQRVHWVWQCSIFLAPSWV